MADWHPGDRVQVLLSSGNRPGRGWPRRWFTGTVREVDPPGLPPGVRVDLDQAVRGVSDCYATHAELQRVPGLLDDGASGGGPDARP